MKIAISIIISFCFLLILTLNSFASETAYSCKVLHVYEPQDDGSLKTSNWDKQFRDKEFSVSRVTGEIIGQVIPTLLADSTEVIHKGNNEHSFKTIAHFKNQVQLLEVKEFIQGEKKPFVAMSMGGAGIVSGTCK